MTKVLLIYPYFHPRWDRSVFRFPPLGPAYVAAALERDGHQVRLLDCTFLDRRQALQEALGLRAEVVGLYCMASMVEECLWFAKHLRPACGLLMVGGPLPTCDPIPFLEHFDVVVRGEGERTACEVVRAWSCGADWKQVEGITFRRPGGAEGKPVEQIVFTPDRRVEANLDEFPRPARHLLPNADYIQRERAKSGFSVSTVLSTRGCPYRCEFCSNTVFGGSYRERSAESVVDEMEDVLRLGYDRISFADDVFTMRKERVLSVCAEIDRRGRDFQWECLGRVDTLDEPTAQRMKRAGCTRIYFGIESGVQTTLDLMDKKTTPEQGRRAVEAAHRAGLEVGAFFIVCYPGDSDESVLTTLQYVGSLPLDYLGLTIPYPLPGTQLLERIRCLEGWTEGSRGVLSNQVPLYDASFSKFKMQFAVFKGQVEFRLRKKGGRVPGWMLRLFSSGTDTAFRLMR